jgi:hypothetical protein
MTGTSRRRKLNGGAAVTVVLAVVIGFLLTRGINQTATATPRRVSTSTSPARMTFTTGDATKLATHLTSGDPATVESSTVLPPGQVLPASTVRGMAALAPMSMDVSSFKPVEADVATVVATTGHGGRWRLTIARQAGQAGRWKLLDTKKMTP